MLADLQHHAHDPGVPGASGDDRDDFLSDSQFVHDTLTSCSPIMPGTMLDVYMP